METDPRDEFVEGHVMDIACIRKAPADELPRRAADHTTDCALMGHCIESGYGLIDDEGRVHLLDPGATVPVVQHLLETSQEQGCGLRFVGGPTAAPCTPSTSYAGTRHTVPSASTSPRDPTAPDGILAGAW